MSFILESCGIIWKRRNGAKLRLSGFGALKPFRGLFGLFGAVFSAMLCEEILDEGLASLALADLVWGALGAVVLARAALALRVLACDVAVSAHDDLALLCGDLVGVADFAVVVAREALAGAVHEAEVVRATRAAVVDLEHLIRRRRRVSSWPCTCACVRVL